MCGRYVLRVILKNLRRDFELGFDVHETDLPMEARPRYNIAPTQMVSVIRVVDGVRRHSLVRWGLIPHWSKEVRKPQINARGDEMRGLFHSFPPSVTGFSRDLKVPLSPFNFAHDGPRADTPPRKVGADSEAILSELGYDAGTIASLRAKKVI